MSTELHDEPTEPDRIPGRLIAISAIGTVIAILASALVVWLLAGSRVDGGGEVAPQRPPPAEIDAIDTPSFHTAMAGEAARAARRARLDAWEWSDPAHRRVRVPVDVAIDRYLAAHGGAR
jgi:hypothetical protein